MPDVDLANKSVTVTCNECDSKVISNIVPDAVSVNYRYRAYCKCKGVNGRSELRAMKAFVYLNNDKVTLL